MVSSFLVYKFIVHSFIVQHWIFHFLNGMILNHLDKFKESEPMCHVLSPPSQILSLEGGKACLLFKSSLATVFPVAQIEISSSRKGAQSSGGGQVLNVFVPVFQRKVTLIQILWHRCKGLSENASQFVFNIGLYLKPFSCLINEVHDHL